MGSGGEEAMLADLMALHGLTEEAARAALDPKPEIRLPACVAPAVRLFSACLGQWRTAGLSGIVIGLDLTAVGEAARWLGLIQTPRLLADLQTLEAEALQAMEARREALARR